MISEMNFLERIGYILSKYGTSYLKGAGTTLVIALVSTFIGCIIGFLVGIVQTIPVDKTKGSRNRDPLAKRILLIIVNAILKAYGLSQLFGVQLGMWQAAFLVVSINTGAYMAESVRGGIISVDPGQMEGAKAIGMTHFQAMINVILPQAFRNILPQIGNNLIINIKDTSVLSVISIVDLFFVHKSVSGALYTYFESATIVMVIYLTMTLITSKLLRLWESKMDGSENYELVDMMDIGTQLGSKQRKA